jgi:branched-subunit amino acid transport protein
VTIWLAFLIAGIVTYLTRASFIAIGTNVELPDRVKRALPFVGPAVFAAIVAPPVFGPDGFAGLAAPRPEVLAAIVAAVVAWKFKNLAAVLVAGMIGLWVFQALSLFG